ncbi:uncharacterized protein LOC132759843 [Ruditapes philippinarum]|uniref:uncharacterized protein LOC132759843 n=1 Tax=Ruditapes philippinarum TaxID=129788 RepID=UPI00295ACE4D|nr:uncharacterized protein LOC132759843 [Ruditapes philippinarum]
MDFVARLLSFLLILQTVTLYVNGSLCSLENRTADLSACLDKTKEVLLLPDKFWFGSDFSQRCPNNEDSGVFCMNPKPSAQSIQVRLFSSTDFTAGLDRFLELKFESGGKNYKACGNTFKTTETWSYNADPLSDTVVYPWYVKNFPVSVNWSYTSGDLYTLMVYDAGYMTSSGLYINILNDDILSADVIRDYVQPLIGTDIKNPYLFMLFKQNGKITLSEEWMKRFTTGNMAGAWTIEEFTTAVNMNGLVAVNWIVVTGDEWAAQTMMDRGGPYALCPLFATKALHEKTRPFIPSDTQLSVWVDFDYMVPADENMNVCCKDFSYRAENFTVNPLGSKALNTWQVRTGIPYDLTFTKLGYFSQRHNFSEDMYTVIGHDPDVPIPAAGTEERPILHLLATNIVDGNFKEGDISLAWEGPFPFADTVPTRHDYYTLVYKQQGPINATELRYKYAGNCQGRLAGRCLYDINRAVSDNSLTLVGATWFIAQKDPYVLKRQIDNTGSDEAEVCKGLPGYMKPCTGSAIIILPSHLNVSILFLLCMLVF